MRRLFLVCLIAGGMAFWAGPEAAASTLYANGLQSVGIASAEETSGTVWAFDLPVADDGGIATRGAPAELPVGGGVMAVSFAVVGLMLLRGVGRGRWGQPGWARFEALARSRIR